MIVCLNIARMKIWSLFIGPADFYGDMVIWIGPLYVSWYWRWSEHGKWAREERARQAARLKEGSDAGA